MNRKSMWTCQEEEELIQFFTDFHERIFSRSNILRKSEWSKSKSNEKRDSFSSFSCLWKAKHDRPSLLQDVFSDRWCWCECSLPFSDHRSEYISNNQWITNFQSLISASTNKLHLKKKCEMNLDHDFRWSSQQDWFGFARDWANCWSHVDSEIEDDGQTRGVHRCDLSFIGKRDLTPVIIHATKKRRIARDRSMVNVGSSRF